MLYVPEWHRSHIYIGVLLVAPLPPRRAEDWVALVLAPAPRELMLSACKVICTLTTKLSNLVAQVPLPGLDGPCRWYLKENIILALS